MFAFIKKFFANAFSHPITTLAGVIGFLEIAVPQILAFVAGNPAASITHLIIGSVVLLIGAWAKHG